ncbi:FeoA family protein [Flavobacterium urocaniciphilum]|uniref:Ferrous iron transport protein A n=1 Tax=Flavobacterium urocaniciphilum TaxID=1299341 RepID=A0A1H9E4L6_9FLAO|nr:FeoA family protein [Flavobacterium urocaniciphilum]SEQ19838.1 ferrous iron transport protein A [Flavobacterium urocaniciphilum]
MSEYNASILKKGQSAQITDINIDEIPLKLIEMGCLPGNDIELIQIAPMGDPLFFNVNDSKVAIRKKTASAIYINQESIK